MKIILPDGSVQEAEDELRAIRHTASHVLAQAVKRLYPETKLAIGPAIDDGFYYDFDREGGFTPEDLEKLESEMTKIVKENLPVKPFVLPRDEAIKFMDGLSGLTDGRRSSVKPDADQNLRHCIFQ